MEQQDKKTFWKRMVLFVMMSLVAPITYLLIRFKDVLFNSSITTTISIWGIIMICIVFLFCRVLIKYYASGMKHKYSMLKQVLDGIVKVVIPFALLITLTVLLKNKVDVIVANLHYVIEALSIVGVCETIAMIINPLPKWAFENNVEGISEIVDSIFKKDKGEEE